VASGAADTHSSPEDVVLSERRDAALVLTLNRPGKLNAISTPMLHLLERRLNEARSDRGVRAVILTGAGGKAFVAGADIGEYAGQSAGQFEDYQRLSRRVFSLVDGLPKPVIAAVNGYALGGGFELALCCDLIVASTTARFGLPEGLLGLSPGGGGTQRLTRAVGRYVAARVLLAAERLTGEDARALGLVVAVVEPDSLLEAAMDLARRTGRVGPLAATEIERLVATALDQPLDTGLDREHDSLFRLYRTNDAAEGIRAFVEKRDPRFEGR
jgi:enoyl-CoA hydratase